MAISATDSMGPLKLRALQSLARQGKLKVRVAECFGLSYGKQMEELGIEAGFGNELFHTSCLKNFADGGLGASTAWFTAPYTDNASNYAIASDTMQHPEAMFADYKRADQAGLQLITHAITPSSTSTNASKKKTARASRACLHLQRRLRRGGRGDQRNR
jgi:predicted amidohydrolase YtcJ